MSGRSGQTKGSGWGGAGREGPEKAHGTDSALESTEPALPEPRRRRPPAASCAALPPQVCAQWGGQAGETEGLAAPRSLQNLVRAVQRALFNEIGSPGYALRRPDRIGDGGPVGWGVGCWGVQGAKGGQLGERAGRDSSALLGRNRCGVGCTGAKTIQACYVMYQCRDSVLFCFGADKKRFFLVVGGQACSGVYVGGRGTAGWGRVPVPTSPAPAAHGSSSSIGGFVSFLGSCWYTGAAHVSHFQKVEAARGCGVRRRREAAGA